VAQRTALSIEGSNHSINELTSIVLGRGLSLGAALDFVESISADPCEAPTQDAGSAVVWVGSIGYEQYRSVDDFARLIAASGVERLVDVRELPISRRRGFAKSALAEALAKHSVEYIHVRSMGNPKEFRDLYKAGKVAEGRAGFEQLLFKDRINDLQELASTIQEKPSALMCVEDDESVCHRQVIFTALRAEIGLKLEVTRIAQ
jgi:hypothetical protein